MPTVSEVASMLQPTSRLQRIAIITGNVTQLANTVLLGVLTEVFAGHSMNSKIRSNSAATLEQTPARIS